MLRVTIELVPFGDEDRKKRIGLIEVANIGPGPDGLFNYLVELKKTAPWKGALKERWRRGTFEDDEDALVREVEGFDRVRHGPYDLLYRALKACGMEERNP